MGFFPVDNGDGSTETASDEDVASAGRAVRARKPPPEFNRVDWVEFMDMRHASITQRAAPMTAGHTPRGTELDADDDWAELVGQLKAERDHEMLQRLTAEAERHEFAEQLRYTQGQLFRVTAERDQLAAQLKNEWIGAPGERAIFRRSTPHLAP